jgi:arginine decarboxylase-like protein
MKGSRSSIPWRLFMPVLSHSSTVGAIVTEHKPPPPQEFSTSGKAVTVYKAVIVYRTVIVTKAVIHSRVPPRIAALSFELPGNWLYSLQNFLSREYKSELC